jgi:hypothetical protein
MSEASARAIAVVLLLPDVPLFIGILALSGSADTRRKIRDSFRTNFGSPASAAKLVVPLLVLAGVAA